MRKKEMDGSASPDSDATDIDLSGIDPLKWADVRRRIGVIKNYLKIAHPTGADHKAHAAALGLGTAQFYNLLRAWRAAHDASALVSGIRDVARPSRSRSGGVDPRARDIARSVIVLLGRDASLDSLVVETNNRCSAANVRPPSRGTIWGLAREVAANDANAAPDGILVARSYMLLPILVDNKVEFPTVAMAVETPSNRILEIVMTTEEDENVLKPLVAAIRERLNVIDLPITATDGDEGRLAASFPAATIKSATHASISKALASTVGKRIGHIQLRSRRPTVGAAVVMQSVRDSALPLKDARKAIASARDHHNQSIAGSLKEIPGLE